MHWQSKLHRFFARKKIFCPEFPSKILYSSKWAPQTWDKADLCECKNALAFSAAASMPMKKKFLNCSSLDAFDWVKLGSPCLSRYPEDTLIQASVSSWVGAAGRKTNSLAFRTPFQKVPLRWGELSEKYWTSPHLWIWSRHYKTFSSSALVLWLSKLECLSLQVF